MSRDASGPDESSERAYSNPTTGGWFGYAPLPDAGDPPDEAYSRVTNPERFRPLHGAALGLVERLTAEFDVEMSEGYDLYDLGVGRESMARPMIILSPGDLDCAPITVAFTDFPGVRIRFGKWVEECFPDCGCDACDEDADEEIAYMIELFESVVSGGFLEAIRIPRVLGDGLVGAAFSEPDMPMTDSERTDILEWRKGGRNPFTVFSESVLTSYERLSERGVKRSTALDMTGGSLYMEYDWKPWPRRQRSQNGESKV